MDESAIEKAGIAPLVPALDAIGRLQSKRAIPPLLAAEHINENSSAFFNFGSNQDFENAQQVIAFAMAGGLGLPDRDYYVKNDQKSQETRQKYLDHIARILVLAGESADSARHDAAVVMAIETAMAKASLTRVEKREPHNLFHKLTTEDFKALTPAFDWDAYFASI